MLVADNTQQSSSATLGAGEAIEVGITNDPVFMQMLSANLYSNQALAFIRETLCNAWDIHIECGLEHKAIYVALTKDYDLIIRDFGRGIPPELMGKVYGTYGASTKANNSAVTGGFGLGCKSPWAYVDSFRVTSCCNGKKTVYNMAKASIESKGKPAIVPVVTTDSDETGLTVTIRIDPNDVREITKYIRYITLHGEMKVDFQEGDNPVKRLPVLGMSFEPGSYNFDDEVWYDDYMGYGNVYIRYGNVIYPVLETPGTEAAVNLIERFMHIVGLRRIVVQAKPDTLAVSPSRETLSSQKMTVDGIVDVCTDLVDVVERDIVKLIPECMKACLKKLSRGSRHQHYHEVRFGDYFDHIPNNMIRQYMRSNLGERYRKHYRAQIMNAEMDGMMKQYGIKPTDPMHKVLRNALFLAKKRQNIKYLSRVMDQYITKPVMRVFAQNPELNLKCMRMFMVRDYHHDLFNKDFRPNYSRYGHYTFKKNLALLTQKKTVFITTRLKEVEASIYSYPPFKETGNHQSAIVYHISTKKNAKDKPIEIFTQAGFDVVDLTLNHEWDINVKARERKQKAKAAKPVVPNGLIPLGNIISELEEDYYIFNPGLIRTATEWKGTCDKPLIYVDIEAVADEQLGYFGNIDLFTPELIKRTVVVRNGTERAMAKRRGALNVDAYFFAGIATQMLSKEMKTYLTKERQKSLRDVHGLEANTLNMLRALDIKLPGMAKLRHDRKLEAVYRCVEKLKPDVLHQSGVIDAGTCSKLHDVLNMELVEFAWIKQIKNCTNDEFIRRMGVEHIRRMVQAMPERKAALRSLVLSALKNGTDKCKIPKP